MIRGIIFDLGGTLLCSPLDGQWEQAFARMDADLLSGLQALGYTLNREAFFQRFGAIFTALDSQSQADWREITTAQVLTQTLAELGAPPLSPAALTQALRAYYAYSESLWQPMPGVYEVVQQLQATGLKLAIVSNANDSGNVDRLIDSAQLRGYFDPILVSSRVGLRKPSPGIFRPVLEAWGLAPGNCTVVGDTLDTDIRGAQLTGLHSLWLNSKSNLAQRGGIVPEATISDLADLPRALAAW
jgi:putative hydrolase of the HAD superfamily